MGYFWFGLCLQFAHALKRDKLWQSNEIPCKPVLIRTGYVVIPPTVHKQDGYCSIPAEYRPHRWSLLGNVVYIRTTKIYICNLPQDWNTPVAAHTPSPSSDKREA